MNKRLFIFTECGESIGFGHLSRCLALYYEAQKQGIETMLVVNASAKGIWSLTNVNATFCDWQNTNTVREFQLACAYCIVDSYIANEDVYKYISKTSLKALYFDDFNRITYPKGIIVNAQANRKYQNMESLIGIDYALVREEFIKTKKQNTRDSICTIMVSLGADLHGLADKVIKALSQNFGNVCIHLVQSRDSDKKYGNNVVRHSELLSKDMANLIAECDIGVIPASQTALEFCSVCTPFVCIKTADNQNEAWLLENNIIEEIIRWDDENFLQKTLEKVGELCSYESREKLRIMLKSIIKTDSAERIIKRLTK